MHVAMPIRVTYWDGANKPSLAMACTYDISPHGARVTGLQCVPEAGEIIAVERGKNKVFCRITWVGEPNSELGGQLGIECIESGRVMWEAELLDLEELYDPILEDNILRRNFVGAARDRRRRRERYNVAGQAELTEDSSLLGEAGLRNLSELGCLVTASQALLPGTDLKLALNVDNYDLSIKGQVRHVDPALGLGIEFAEIRKGDRQILKFLLRKLAEKQLEEVFQLEV